MAKQYFETRSKTSWFARIAGIALLVICPPIAQAKIEVAPVLTDHAVLQEGEPVPVWGTAMPGEGITVEFAGQTATATADIDGKWSVKLSPMRTSAEPRDLVIQSSEEKLKLTDILVGEVWLCSGQSNMYMPLEKTSWSGPVMGSAEEIARPEDPELRLYSPSSDPLWKKAGLSGWQRANTKSRAPFSATAYFFGNSLRASLKVPIGLIDLSVGGSSIQEWLPADEVLKSEFASHYRQIYLQNKENIEKYNTRVSRYYKIMDERSADHVTSSNPSPELPDPLTSDLELARRFADVGNLYEEFIAPIVPYPIRGVIWYQGESNADKLELALNYEQMLPMLISYWRAQWGQPQLPFYFVQLPCWDDPNAKTWPVNRQSMLAMMRTMTSVGMAITVDVGDIHNLHPANKRPVGERLALWALSKNYGKPIICSGPIPQSARDVGDSLQVKFDVFGSSLRVHGARWEDVELAGDDGLYYPAKATIDGDSAIVSSPSVMHPKSVRYGWKAAFTPTLFDQDGLPASPFELSTSDSEKVSSATN